jgi:hypothetical protein
MAVGPLFPPTTLATLRQQQTAGLRHRCDILTPARTRSAGAVATTAYAAASASDEDVACLLTLEAPTPAVAGAAPTVAQSGEVRFAYGRAIAAGQRLDVTHDLAGIDSPLTVEVVGAALAYRASTRVRATVL